MRECFDVFLGCQHGSLLSMLAFYAAADVINQRSDDIKFYFISGRSNQQTTYLKFSFAQLFTMRRKMSDGNVTTYEFVASPFEFRRSDTERHAFMI